MARENIAQTYRERPNHYEIYMKYLTIFKALKKLNDANKPLIIAIEGRCGSGKSSLATLLSEMFTCNVFHMDDFFLPFEMKTTERLAQPGGNVHYERFHAEILRPLENHKAVTYCPYHCKERVLGDPIHVEFKNLNIVEGVYSLHPVLRQTYDYRIFLTVDSQVQKERIRKRNGEEMLQNFINKWIPMEEHYFSALKIEAQCDIVFDTTVLWK